MGGARARRNPLSGETRQSQQPWRFWLATTDNHRITSTAAGLLKPGALGAPAGEGGKGPLTCTTRTKLSGYLVKTVEKASTGSRSTVESRAARADTVRWGCWWPWGGGRRGDKVRGSLNPSRDESGVLPPQPPPSTAPLGTHRDDVQNAQEAVDAVPGDYFLHNTLLPVLRHRGTWTSAGLALVTRVLPPDRASRGNDPWALPPTHQTS